MTVLMAGGGTGGHVMPAIAVAEDLRRRGHEAFFVGTERGMESRIVPRAGFELERIEIAGFNQLPLGRKARALWLLPRSVAASRSIIARRRPDAVFSMGGYVAAPPMIAARLKKIPIVLMEPNAIPGLVSRWMAGSVKRALLSHEDARRFFPADRTEITGLPVRREFFDIAPVAPQKPLRVLLTGGSQGSKRINDAAHESWPRFAAQGWPVRFMHQAGRATGAEFLAAFAAANVPGEAVEFIDDMPAAFAAADLIICRSGAGAIAELAAAGKPSILIPYPFAADNHQLLNARAMERAGAATIIEDRELTGEKLFGEIRKLIAEPGRLEAMGASAKALAKPAAVERAVNVLESLTQC